MTAHYEIPDISGIEIIRERTRRAIAFISVLGYFLILGVIALGGPRFLGLNIDDALKVLTTTAGVLGGVVGAVVGFYFRNEN